MTKEQVLNSIALKKRFCKNCNLPIDLFDEPYFSERLEILDFQFDCVRKFNEFCVEMEKFEDEQAYFQYYNTIKESVINMIKANSDFNKFLKDDFNEMSESPRPLRSWDGQPVSHMDNKEGNNEQNE